MSSRLAGTAASIQAVLARKLLIDSAMLSDEFIEKGEIEDGQIPIPSHSRLMAFLLFRVEFVVVGALLR